MPLFAKKLEPYKYKFRELKLGRNRKKKGLETTEPKLLGKALRKHDKKYASCRRCLGGANQILATT